MKNTLLNIINYIKYPFIRIKLEIEYRKKIKKLREQDPFIYN